MQDDASDHSKKDRAPKKVDWRSRWRAATTQKERNALRPQLPAAGVASMGCRFMVHPADNFTELKLWETGRPPEYAATQFLCEALEDADPVIVDVGANVGAFFLPIHRAGGSAARSVVFEPNPAMRARLDVNIRLNGLQDRVQVFDCAISDQDGAATLHFPRNGNMGQGRVDAPYPHKRVPDAISVAVRPLVDCLIDAAVPHVDLLKVDVEGLEDRVIVPLLMAGERWLPKLIYFEIAHDQHWQLPLRDKLADAGYELVQKFDANALFSREA